MADITQNDLNLMMQSYENMILMHKTVLDQQTTMTELLGEVVKNQSNISTKQMSVCTTLEGVVKQLDTCSVQLSKSQEKMDTTDKSLTKDLNTHNVESVKEHGKITNKIYIAFGLSGTIILGLIGLLLKS